MFDLVGPAEDMQHYLVDNRNGMQHIDIKHLSCSEKTFTKKDVKREKNLHKHVLKEKTFIKY
ncbi:hypothetical protein KUTeg_004521 [Tegillarca granosa]|uniref:Uncharacterized protein n=1 Tax=Tegillarca granosa TaxID=220873 RepID=A0ABQ9FQ97_TEGGR|nr:hypothetical protein KUTeg_004521 [Tegillarca granosa]